MLKNYCICIRVVDMKINLFQLYQQYTQSLAIPLHYAIITFLRVCHHPFDKCIFDIVHGETLISYIL